MKALWKHKHVGGAKVLHIAPVPQGVQKHLSIRLHRVASPRALALARQNRAIARTAFAQLGTITALEDWSRSPQCWRVDIGQLRRTVTVESARGGGYVAWTSDTITPMVSEHHKRPNMALWKVARALVELQAGYRVDWADERLRRHFPPSKDELAQFMDIWLNTTSIPDAYYSSQLDEFYDDNGFLPSDHPLISGGGAMQISDDSQVLIADLKAENDALRAERDALVSAFNRLLELSNAAERFQFNEALKTVLIGLGNNER